MGILGLAGILWTSSIWYQYHKEHCRVTLMFSADVRTPQCSRNRCLSNLQRT
jgi:hypothetical protein